MSTDRSPLSAQSVSNSAEGSASLWIKNYDAFIRYECIHVC